MSKLNALNKILIALIVILLVCHVGVLVLSHNEQAYGRYLLKSAYKKTTAPAVSASSMDVSNWRDFSKDGIYFKAPPEWTNTPSVWDFDLAYLCKNPEDRASAEEGKYCPEETEHLILSETKLTINPELEVKKLIEDKVLSSFPFKSVQVLEAGRIELDNIDGYLLRFKEKFDRKWYYRNIFYFEGGVFML